MKSNLITNVRQVNNTTSIIDIQGEITGFSENILMDACTLASKDEIKNIILNFTALEYMNSSGIGLLVTLLIRTRRNNQTLLAFGLNDHYKQIFNLTRLNEAIQIFNTEEEALPTTGSRK
jgi:anti-sigma B factor antagonist